MTLPPCLMVQTLALLVAEVNTFFAKNFSFGLLHYCHRLPPQKLCRIFMQTSYKTCRLRKQFPMTITRRAALTAGADRTDRSERRKHG